jgi:hypothetical protein
MIKDELPERETGTAGRHRREVDLYQRSSAQLLHLNAPNFVNRQPGKFDGIPCEVRLVRRLESHWYDVLFYTDEYWGACK